MNFDEIMIPIFKKGIQCKIKTDGGNTIELIHNNGNTYMFILVHSGILLSVVYPHGLNNISNSKFLFYDETGSIETNIANCILKHLNEVL